MMDAPNCPTCSKPMVPCPALPTAWGMGSTVYGAPGDPAFICTVDDAAHDAARAARAVESKRLLDEAAAIRAAREKDEPKLRAIAEKERAALAAKE